MKLFKHTLIAWLVLFSQGAAWAQDRVQVVAVNYPLQYIANRLLGEAADVVFPVPQDIDPSFWRPSIADITMIQSADLILLNGAGFATWIDRVSLPRARIVNTTAAVEDQYFYTESITHSHGEGEEHSHEGLASYVWLDPSLAIAQAQAVAAAIISRGLAPEDEVAPQLEALIADFEALDAQTRAAVADLQGIAMIATHPRYQYFARAYGLSIASLEWEAGALPTDEELAALASLAQETGAQVLIWEAKPPAEAFEATRALGLQNIVFGSLAHQIEGSSFLETFEEAVAAMSDVQQP